MLVSVVRWCGVILGSTAFESSLNEWKYILIKQYKKSPTYIFVKQRQITLSPNEINTIWKNLDINQELSLGYINKLNETNENKL